MAREGGNVYNIPISATTLSTVNVWDLFTFTASSSGRFELVRVEVVLHSTQYVIFPALGFQILTGSTGVGSTASAITPVNVKRTTGNKAADFTATGATSTVLSTASATLVFASALDPESWVYEPEECCRPLIGLSGVMMVRTTLPSVSAIVSATATIREMGKGLPS